METIRKGRPEPLELSDAGNDEIGVLSGTYNYMTAEINHLMDYEEKAAKELRNAEFRALAGTDQSSFSLQYTGYDQLAFSVWTK